MFYPTAGYLSYSNCLPTTLKPTLKPYECFVSYEAETKASSIQKVARHVAALYARQLDPKYCTQNAYPNLAFVGRCGPIKFPSTAQVKSFQKALANAIIDEYSQESHVAIVTLYAPGEILSKSLAESGITESSFDNIRFFPLNMQTVISKDKKCTQINITISNIS